MTSTMLRKCMTAAVALAALTATALAPVSSVEAGPAGSPFAGTYVVGLWTLTISDNGRITGSYSGVGYVKVSFSGQVSDDGSYSSMFSVTYEEPEYRGRGPKFIKMTEKSAGTMALDADGNIVGTPDTGGSFLWIRQ